MKEIELIKMYFKRCINNRSIFWPFHSSFEHFIIYLNELKSINKIYIWKDTETTVNEKEKIFQELNFLDVWVIFNKQTRTMIADVYYKTPNTHNCFPYTIVQTLLIKTNVPRKVAYRISQCLFHELLQLKKD